MSPAACDRGHGLLATLCIVFGLGLASFAWSLVQLLGLIADQQAGLF